jgi:hypothetical protein
VFCTRLDSGRVQVPPAGKKSSLYPYPSGQVPIPKLPSLKISITEPCQQRLVSFLPADPKPPIAGTRHIAENLLHHCKVILLWLLQKMTHVVNNKCKIRMSIHQISQTPDDASICCSIHQRMHALLAQLQVSLHGYMTWIASCHVTPLQNLHRVGTLTKRNTTCALLHFNAELVVKQAEVAHFERSRHLLLERPDVVAVRAGDDEIVDVYPNHQLHIVVPPDVDDVFRRSPPKA